MIALGLALIAAGAWSLEWRAPAACPDAGDLRRRVESMLGGAPVGPILGRVTVRAIEAGLFEGQLELQVGSATTARVLRAERCDGLVEAVAVIVALTLDRAEAASGPSPRAVLRPPAPTVAAPPPGRVGWGVSMAAELGAGQLPGLGLGAAARAYVDLEPLRLWGGGLVWQTGDAGDARRGATVALWSGELRLGVPLWLGPVEVEPALLVEVGRLTARGAGQALVGPPRVRRTWHLAPGLGVSVGLPVGGPVWVVVHLGGRWNLSRPTILLDDEDPDDGPARFPVYRPARLVPRGGLAVELRFR